MFIDEAGCNLSMTLPYGRAPSGERLYEHRPSVRTKKTSLVGAMTTAGIVAMSTIAGSFNAARFLQWLQDELLPKIGPGKVLVWDNVKFHYNKDVLAAVAAAGCSVLKMPPYSPDLNPIEECWSKLKHFVRAAKARTQDALDDAIVDAIDRLADADFIGWIAHAGYALAGST